MTVRVLNHDLNVPFSLPSPGLISSNWTEPPSGLHASQPINRQLWQFNDIIDMRMGLARFHGNAPTPWKRASPIRMSHILRKLIPSLAAVYVTSGCSRRDMPWARLAPPCYLIHANPIQSGHRVVLFKSTLRLWLCREGPWVFAFTNAYVMIF